MSCDDGGGIYNIFRHQCGPTLYGSNKTPVTADVLEAGFFFAAACLFVSFIIIIPGFRGHTKWFLLLRSFIALFILTCIMACNFGQEWEVSHISVITPYRAGLQEEIHAHVGVKIGLRSVNITLVGDPEVATFKNGTHEERINYNERFHWDNLGFNLGRAGFGPFSGRFNQEFREAQRKGVPYPILWIAEYFTIDGENIRWGRHYLQAGWWTHIMIWAAFPLWILAVSTTFMVLMYSGILFFILGIFLLVGNALFATIRNAIDLNGVIPFETSDHEEDVHMVFTFGWCFWLNMINGIVCLVIGIIIVVMDCRAPETLTSFFGVDILQEYEEFYADPAELAEYYSKFKSVKHRPKLAPDSPIAMTSTNPDDDDDVYEDVDVNKPHFRRRENSGAATIRRILGKSRPILPPRQRNPLTPPGSAQINNNAFKMEVPQVHVSSAQSPEWPPKDGKLPLGLNKEKTQVNNELTPKQPKWPPVNVAQLNGDTKSPPSSVSSAEQGDTTPLIDNQITQAKKALKPPVKKLAPETAPKPSGSKTPSPRGSPPTPPSKPSPKGSPPNGQSQPTRKALQPPVSASKPSVPPSAPIRDNSGRSEKEEPIFSGEYDNNYEDVSAVNREPPKQSRL